VFLTFIILLCYHVTLKYLDWIESNFGQMRSGHCVLKLQGKQWRKYYKKSSWNCDSKNIEEQCNIWKFLEETFLLFTKCSTSEVSLKIRPIFRYLPIWRNGFENKIVRKKFGSKQWVKKTGTQHQGLVERSNQRRQAGLYATTWLHNVGYIGGYYLTNS
jgi:hypothetical protein